MEEQRFVARVQALAAAARWSSSNTGAVLQAAELFEAWLLRPTSVEVTTVGSSRPEFIPRYTDEPEVPARAECGAFLRPAWYTDEPEFDRPWLVCSGEHNPLDGWHISAADQGGTFASHHYIGRDGRQCSCGAYEFPCANASRTDMRT